MKSTAMNKKRESTVQFNRFQDESFEDYFIRLYENKSKYDLTCKQIASLLNSENGKSFDESAYRKRYADFYRGRVYEREHSSEYVAQTVLALSDLHVPYNMPVETFSQYTKAVDTLVLNGDVLDCQSISRFPKKYRIDLIDEMIAARQYIIDLVNMIQPKQVFITKGNHEHRMLNYLSNRLNEDLLSLMPDSPMDLIINDGFKNVDRLNHTEMYYSPLRDVFNEKDINVRYNGDWFCRVGNVIFAHPLAYSSPMMKTAERAVTYFTRNAERTFTALVMAHTHKVGFYKVGDISMYEQGCLCNLDQIDYANGKLQDPQQNGYVFLSLNRDGNIIEEKSRLITKF